MAAIYLKHKRHGAKVASTEDEAEADIKRGWVEFDIDEEMTKKAEKAVEESQIRAGELARSNQPDTRPVTSSTSDKGKELVRQGAPDSTIAQADIEEALEHKNETAPVQVTRGDGQAEGTIVTPPANRRRRGPAVPTATSGAGETAADKADKAEDADKKD